jgi:lysyl-tRNA synthetase class 2
MDWMCAPATETGADRTPAAMPDATPSGNAGYLPTASLDMLRRRAALLRELRRTFDDGGYFEVETPLLSHDVCVDAWLDPFIVPDAGAPDGRPMFLQTSPEYGMKRLLASGANAIYQVTRSFRRGESGRYHNPEFTIVEWYRVASTPAAQMDFIEDLVQRLSSAAQGQGEALRGRALNQPCRRLAYDDAFAEFAGQSVSQCSMEELAGMAARHRVPVPPAMPAGDRDAWLNLLLAIIVEPALSRCGGVFLYDYPPSQAALARVREGDPPVAERFELYLDGIEICNGYHELTDGDELRKRQARQSELRQRAGMSRLPVDSRLLQAMDAGLPDCTGVALGFDRLAMWCLGANDLSQVIPFPYSRA